MLGGVEVTDKAREHARDMLNAAERGIATGRGAAAGAKGKGAR